MKNIINKRGNKIETDIKKLKFIYEETNVRENGEIQITRVKKSGLAAVEEIKKHGTEIKDMLSDILNNY